jgi:hypothetical protein
MSVLWGESGRAADITAMTDSGPEADIGRIKIPQRSSLLPHRDVLSLFGHTDRADRRYGRRY